MNNQLKSFLILLVGITIASILIFMVVTATSNKAVDLREKQRNEQIKEDYARFSKWARELTTEQRDSVIQLRKAVRGY